jgi:glycosyltransferase involved in cell wall biosynthesis
MSPHARQPRLVVDARKAWDTGIGTHVRQVVPRVLQRLPGQRAALLVSPGTAARHRDYLGGSEAELLECPALPFSLGEQIALRRMLTADDLFWATSLAHPLYRAGRMVNTVHDLAQLALPPRLGGDARTRGLARPFFHSICRGSDLLLFSSRFTAAEFSRCVGAPRAPTQVIPLGVDGFWFDAGRAGDGPPAAVAGVPYLVMLGNRRPHKNLPTALRALQQIGSRLPHRLLLIGPGDTRGVDGETAGLIASLGDRVVLAGTLAPEAVRAALRGAEALLFPSHYEGFGLPILEAMACGCPVLAARNGTSEEVLGRPADFDPDDADALARALLALAALPSAARRTQVDAGIAHARTMSWERTAEATAAALAPLLARATPAMRARTAA